MSDMHLEEMVQRLWQNESLPKNICIIETDVLIYGLKPVKIKPDEFVIVEGCRYNKGKKQFALYPTSDHAKSFMLSAQESVPGDYDYFPGAVAAVEVTYQPDSWKISHLQCRYKFKGEYKLDNSLHERYLDAREQLLEFIIEEAQRSNIGKFEFHWNSYQSWGERSSKRIKTYFEQNGWSVVQVSHAQNNWLDITM